MRAFTRVCQRRNYYMLKDYHQSLVPANFYVTHNQVFQFTNSTTSYSLCFHRFLVFEIECVASISLCLKKHTQFFNKRENRNLNVDQPIAGSGSEPALEMVTGSAPVQANCIDSKNEDSVTAKKDGGAWDLLGTYARAFGWRCGGGLTEWGWSNGNVNPSGRREGERREWGKWMRRLHSPWRTKFWECEDANWERLERKKKTTMKAWRCFRGRMNEWDWRRTLQEWVQVVGVNAMKMFSFICCPTCSMCSKSNARLFCFLF